MVERGEVIEAGAPERAWDQARAAEIRAGVEVVELVEHADRRAAAALFDAVWGTRADRTPVSPDLLRAFSHTGNYVAGARTPSGLVGASVGFLANGGATHKLHSHITGLAPDQQTKGIGFAIKQHQRAWAIGHGLGVITWTFDPLVRRNAYFNLTRLGAEANAFYVDFYGEMIDRLNVGGESDRCEVTWDLTSARTATASDRSLGAPDVDALLAGGAVPVLEDGGDGGPRCGPLHGEIRLCWIPPDIQALRRSDPNLAQSWRLALRDTLGASIDEGFVASGMTRSGWYVLEPLR